MSKKKKRRGLTLSPVLAAVLAVALVGVGVLSAMLLQHRVVLPSAATEEGACIYLGLNLSNIE